MKKLLLFAFLMPILGITAQAQILTAYINFGNSALAMGDNTTPVGGNFWNNVNDQTALASPISLKANTNVATGISLTVTDKWSGQGLLNTGSATTPVAAFNYNNSYQDYLFIQTSDPTAAFTLTGLDSSKQYRFTLYAARVGSITDNRSGNYTFAGATSQTLTLNASENTSNVVTTGNISPDGTNTITFSMIKAAANNNTNGFTYLQSIEIEIIPEPTTWALLAFSLTTVVVFRRRTRI